MDGKTAAAWPGARFCAVVARTATSGGGTSVETRRHVGSREGMDVCGVLATARVHWGVGSFHWSLDVSFGEDGSRVHADHSPENLNVARHCACDIIRSAHRPRRESIRKSMLRRQHEDDMPDRVTGSCVGAA